jgi:hypothetical protein
MRLPLLVAAGAALAATAAPADAAYYPVCAVNVAPGVPSDTCRTGNTPMLTRTMNRVTDLVVVSGTAKVSVTCFNYPYANTTGSRTLTGPGRVVFNTTEYGGSCTTTLTAVTAGAVANATSTFTVRIVPEPAR